METKTKTDQATATIPSLALPYALYHRGISHSASYAMGHPLLELHRSLSQLGAADATRLGKMTVAELFTFIGDAIGGRTKL